MTDLISKCYLYINVVLLLKTDQSDYAQQNYFNLKSVHANVTILQQ